MTSGRDDYEVCIGCSSTEEWCHCRGEPCWDCGGDGDKLICVDDICHAQGYCMHGNAEAPFDTCEGHGVIMPPTIPVSEFDRRRRWQRYYGTTPTDERMVRLQP